MFIGFGTTHTSSCQPLRRLQRSGLGRRGAYLKQARRIDQVNESERHLRLLTETAEAVNSSLDLQEVLTLIARKVAEALETDACFVYLYDERGDELILRATFGAQLGEEERKPRMRIGEGLTGSSAACLLYTSPSPRD